MTSVVDRPVQSHAWLTPAVVVASQMALAAVIYWPTLRMEFISDSWIYLSRLQASVWETLTTPTGYHWQPVACAWVALIRACFGNQAVAFQAILIGQVGLFAFLTYQLGRRLLPDAGTAYLGSLLVIGNAAFYETTYWPLAGNMHLLAAQLYVLALILTLEVVRGRLVRSGPWLIGLTALAAIFAHPAMITVVPVCAVVLFLASDAPMRSLRPGPERARVLRVLLALSLVLVPFAITRLVFAEEFNASATPRPGLGRMQAYWIVTRGVVAVFSLRGSQDMVHWLMTLGTYASFATTKLWLFVAAWVVVVTLAVAIGLWRARTPGVRVLIAFLALHILIVAIAGGMTSRQSHLPAVAAGLLTAGAFRLVAEGLEKLARTETAVSICRQLPAVGVLLLIVSASTDHRYAADVFGQAANLTRTLIGQLKVVAPPNRGPLNLTLVNMPGYTIGNGIGAATFSNGLTELAHLTTPAVAAVEMRRISISNLPPDFANASELVSLHALRARLLEPSRIALLFQPPSDIRPVTADLLENLAH